MDEYTREMKLIISSKFEGSKLCFHEKARWNQEENKQWSNLFKNKIETPFAVAEKAQGKKKDWNKKMKFRWYRTT